MNRNRVCRAICGLILLLALCACSSLKFPYGTYTFSHDGISGNEVKFNPSGTYVFTTPDGMSFLQGTFSIKGNTFTFLTDVWCYKQGINATYTWKYSNETLVMKDTGNDTCLDRADAIDQIPLHLQK
jgi:hypothetical protein